MPRTYGYPYQTQSLPSPASMLVSLHPDGVKTGQSGERVGTARSRASRGHWAQAEGGPASRLPLLAEGNQG